jgi:hypothetical protein
LIRARVHASLKLILPRKYVPEVVGTANGQYGGREELALPPAWSIDHNTSNLPMGSNKADVWQGTLALTILKTLEALGPLTGMPSDCAAG